MSLPMAGAHSQCVNCTPSSPTACGWTRAGCWHTSALCIVLLATRGWAGHCLQLFPEDIRKGGTGWRDFYFYKLLSEELQSSCV